MEARRLTIAETGMGHHGLTVKTFDPARVGDAARLHCEIFARSPSGRLGPHYTEAMLRWFLGSDPAVVLAAEDGNGKLLGYAVGAPVAYGSKLRRDLRGTVVGALARRPWALLDSMVIATMAGYVQQLWRQLKRRPGPATTPPTASVPSAPGAASAQEVPPQASSEVWSLVAIAVSPSQRRSGVGRRLLAEFEDRSRRLGASELSLTVTLDNLDARRFYDRSGWQPGPPHPDGTMLYVRTLAEPG